MQLVTPEIGLFFWMFITFVILLILMKKFAWKGILEAVNNREAEIKNALDEAKKAREEVAVLKAENDKTFQKSKVERDAILAEARELKDKIIGEAKVNAEKQASLLLEQAKELIQEEKSIVFNQLKNEVAQISIDMAQKILGTELSNKASHEELIKNQLSKLN